MGRSTRNRELRNALAQPDLSTGPRRVIEEASDNTDNYNNIVALGQAAGDGYEVNSNVENDLNEMLDRRVIYNQEYIKGYNAGKSMTS